MSIRELIMTLIQIGIFFAFPTIWYWILSYIPWWPIDPQTTLGIVTGVIVALVSWILGILGIRRLVNKIARYMPT